MFTSLVTTIQPTGVTKNQEEWQAYLKSSSEFHKSLTFWLMILLIVLLIFATYHIVAILVSRYKELKKAEQELQVLKQAQANQSNYISKNTITSIQSLSEEEFNKDVFKRGRY